jgi:hypothetical protein
MTWIFTDNVVMTGDPFIISGSATFPTGDIMTDYIVYLHYFGNNKIINDTDFVTFIDVSDNPAFPDPDGVHIDVRNLLLTNSVADVIAMGFDWAQDMVDWGMKFYDTTALNDAQLLEFTILDSIAMMTGQNVVDLDPNNITAPPTFISNPKSDLIMITNPVNIDLNGFTWDFSMYAGVIFSFTNAPCAVEISNGTLIAGNLCVISYVNNAADKIVVNLTDTLTVNAAVEYDSDKFKMYMSDDIAWVTFDAAFANAQSIITVWWTVSQSYTAASIGNLESARNAATTFKTNNPDASAAEINAETAKVNAAIAALELIP